MPVQSSHEESVNAHLADSETIQATHVDDDRSVVVTDARLLTVDEGRGVDSTRRIETVSFDGTTSATVDLHDTFSYNRAYALIGLVAGLFSVSMLGWYYLGNPGDLEPAALYSGLLGVVIVVGAVIDAIDLGGQIDVVLHTAGSASEHELSLPRDAEAVASSIFKHAA